MTSPLSGSPLDTLPMSPSCLPMPQASENSAMRYKRTNQNEKTVSNELETCVTGCCRAQLRAAEERITLRSCLCETRWSSEDPSQPTCNRAATTSRVLQVLEILDRQNFARIDHTQYVQRLYEKVFAVLESKENEVGSVTFVHSELSTAFVAMSRWFPQPPISGDCVVKVLCEWAVSVQRSGEHRALVVAKLLERRQMLLSEVRLPLKSMKLIECSHPCCCHVHRKAATTQRRTTRNRKAQLLPLPLRFPSSKTSSSTSSTPTLLIWASSLRRHCAINISDGECNT